MSNKCGVILGVILTIVLMIAFIVGFEVRFKEPEMIEQDYTISAGETMWSIANEFCPKSMDRRDWIYKVCNLNGISQDRIYAGQTITILVEEGE